MSFLGSELGMSKEEVFRGMVENVRVMAGSPWVFGDLSSAYAIRHEIIDELMPNRKVIVFERDLLISLYDMQTPIDQMGQMIIWQRLIDECCANMPSPKMTIKLSDMKKEPSRFIPEMMDFVGLSLDGIDIDECIRKCSSVDEEEMMEKAIEWGKQNGVIDML